MKVAVLGATGHTGRMVVRALGERGLDVIACGRDRERLDALRRIGVETRIADARRRDDVRDALEGADAVANLAGPFLATGHRPIEEAIRRGIPYADTTGEQAFMREARARHDDAARAAGVPVVNALAFEYAFSDLAVGARLAEGGDALHVLYRPRGAQGSAGTKKSVVRILASPALGHEDGRLVPTTPAAHERRFATRDGWRDAMSFPGGEILTVPSHAPFRAVRTYLPAPPGRARFARALAPAARLLLRGPALDAAERVVEARHAPPANEGARGEIYLVAERGGRDETWLVETPDPYLATAQMMAEGVTRLAAAPRATGVVAPAQALDPRGTLDALATSMTGFRVRRVEVLPEGVVHVAAGDDKPI